MRKEMEFFLAVAEEGSFSRAGERLFVGQPSVSKMIAILEDELGMPLFKRKPHGVELTDAGYMYLLYARRVEEIEREMMQELLPFQQADMKMIRIAMTLNTSSLSAFELNDMIASEVPGYRLQIDNVLSKDIITSLREGTYEFAICPQNIVDDQKEFVSEPIYESRWLLITPKTLDLSSESSEKGEDGTPIIPAEVIRRHEVILQEKSTNIRGEIDEILELNQHPEFHGKMTVANSMLAIKEFEDGTGCAIISDTFRIYTDERKVNVYYLKTDMSVTTSLVYKNGRRLNASERSCLRIVCDYLIRNNNRNIRKDR